jgi:hypothetical protein
MNSFVKSICLFSFCLIVFVSCSDLKSKLDQLANSEEVIDTTDFNVVKINNEYQLSVPNYMSEAKNLNDDASLQYQNIFKETYVIVIDESKQSIIDTFLDLGEYDTLKSMAENYRDIQLKMLGEEVKIKSQSSSKSLSINTLNAQQVQLEAEVEDVNEPVTYFLTFIEGKENVYMIMAITQADRQEKYGKTFDAIAQSFKLLNAE